MTNTPSDDNGNDPSAKQKSLELDGISYALDSSGYLHDRTQWNEKVAQHFAAQEGITLTEEHWQVLFFLRTFYEDYRISPMIKVLCRHLEKKFENKKFSKEYLYQLFPKGPAKQGALIAGNPFPPVCID